MNTLNPSTKPDKLAVKAVEQLLALEMSLLAVGVHPSALNPVRDALRDRMESLPINWLGVIRKPVLYFVLVAGEWFPCHAGQETDHRWLNFRTDYEGGITEGGPAQPFRWAHCTADNTVNYHWLTHVEPPEEAPEEEDEDE